MAGLAAVDQLGESLVGLLRARRDLLAAEGRLGPVPPALAIAHVSLSSLATAAEPTGGLTLSCYRVSLSSYNPPTPPARQASQATSIAIELHYLLAAWSAAPADEQAIIPWALLELSAHPVLDRSVLLGGDEVWGRDETVQIVPETLSDDGLFRIWHALQRRYRLSTTFAARVVKIGYGPPAIWPAVVATRFGFADANPLAEGV